MSAPEFELETVRRQIEEAAIHVVETDQLVAYARNARTHSDYQVHLIAQSIKKWGFTNPVLVDGNGGIIAGHGRVLAAYKLGLTRVPCRVLGYLDEAQKQAYVLADNKLAEKAGWDFDMLKDELAEIESYGYDLADLGFEQEELESILAQDNPVDEGLTDPDAVPDVSENPVTKLGDVWILGKHRLMCGDSTKKEMVEQLMNGEKADLWLTDPPYGVSYADKNAFLNAIGNGDRLTNRIKNDHLSIDELEIFWQQVAETAHLFCHNHAPYYWFACQGGDQMMMMMMMSISRANWKVRHELIWVKNNHVLSRCDYHYKHEPILYGWKKDGTHKFFGDFQTSVLEFDKPMSSKLHPTMKPIELLERLIKNSSEQDKIVLDTFLGSGSTLIACEKTGRRCYGTEIEPHYVSVIIERWQDFTGQEARLESTGETYNSLKEKASVS